LNSKITTPFEMFLVKIVASNLELPQKQSTQNLKD
jgi:hypothetical protein